MQDKCVEEGMKLARRLLTLGHRGSGVATASFEEYQRLSKEASAALEDVDKMTCLSNDERAVIKNELTYLKDQAEKANFLYTSDAGARLLNILSNPQFYTDYYKTNSGVNPDIPELKNAFRSWTGEEHIISCALCGWSKSGDNMTELEDAYKQHKCPALKGSHSSESKLSRNDVEVYLSLPPYKANIWVENKKTGKTIWQLEGAENISRFGWKDQNRDQLEESVLKHLEDIGVLSGR